MKLGAKDIDFLRLIQRSHDIGDGWRQMSETLWLFLVPRFEYKELLELNETERKVRLSERGKIVVEYLI